MWTFAFSAAVSLALFVFVSFGFTASWCLVHVGALLAQRPAFHFFGFILGCILEDGADVGLHLGRLWNGCHAWAEVTSCSIGHD